MFRWIFAVSGLAAFALSGGDPLAAQEAGLPAPATCRAGDRAPSLDHVISAVRDLDAAESSFRAQGFTIKLG